MNADPRGDDLPSVFQKSENGAEEQGLTSESRPRSYSRVPFPREVEEWRLLKDVVVACPVLAL
jgi:hypothetical protein